MSGVYPGGGAETFARLCGSSARGISGFSPFPVKHPPHGPLIFSGNS